MRNSPLQRKKAAETLRHTSTIHGMVNTPTWRTWRNIKKRCFTTSYEYYKHYGGRGITVCERWVNSFAAFYEDVGERPGQEYSLERIDNDGNYEPGNCRWATQKEQSRNRQTSFMVTFRGETRCLAEWAEITGIPYRILFSRLRPAWSVEKALTTPPKPHRQIQEVSKDRLY